MCDYKAAYDNGLTTFANGCHTRCCNAMRHVGRKCKVVVRAGLVLVLVLVVGMAVACSNTLTKGHTSIFGNFGAECGIFAAATNSSLNQGSSNSSLNQGSSSSSDNPVSTIVSFAGTTIAASIAAYAAIYTKQSDRKQNIELAKINARLSSQKSEEDAIRDYEFDARKRLYQQFEPLLFQLVENCESAYLRICELARTAQEGNLEPDRGWLKDDGYFKVSTIHKLLLPLVVFRLMQKKLTIFDLDLVPSYKAQYLLAKGLYFTFASDFDLAKSEPHLEYDPPEEDSKEYLEGNITTADPARYKRQGVYRGLLDNLVDALIVPESDGSTRLMNYGEFHDEYFASFKHERFGIMVNLFYNFHPQTSPVLWRILIAQAHFHLAIKCTRELENPKSVTNIKTLKIIPTEERNIFDWRHIKEEPDRNVLIDPFTAVENYLRDPRRGVAQFME